MFLPAERQLQSSIDVRGCDLWAFDAEGKIVRKDSLWKIRETR